MAKDLFFYEGLPSKQEEFGSCADCPFVVLNTIDGDICAETGINVEAAIKSNRRMQNCPFKTK